METSDCGVSASSSFAFVCKRHRIEVINKIKRLNEFPSLAFCLQVVTFITPLPLSSSRQNWMVSTLFAATKGSDRHFGADKPETRTKLLTLCWWWGCVFAFVWWPSAETETSFKWTATRRKTKKQTRTMSNWTGTPPSPQTEAAHSARPLQRLRIKRNMTCGVSILKVIIKGGGGGSESHLADRST